MLQIIILMKRSEFLKQLLAFVALPAMVKAETIKKESKACIYEGEVVGLQYYKAEALVGSMKVGERLILKREPDNKFDTRAIAIYYHEHKMGYMAKRHNKIISKMLDTGHGNFEAVISYLYGEEYPYLTVEYEVWSAR